MKGSYPLDTKQTQRLAYLDGGSIVEIDIIKHRVYLTFSHSYKKGVFKMELDELIFDGVDTTVDAEQLQAMLKVTSLVDKMTGLFDKMRG